MAWKARVAQDIGVTAEGLLSVVIEYFDDADPANANVSVSVPPTKVLWAKAWDLPINTTTAQLQTAVVQEGQKARAWVAARDGARTAVPAGTSVSVP